MGHEAEAVPPLLVVLLVLKKVSREDDALIQRHLWEGRGQGVRTGKGMGPSERVTAWPVAPACSPMKASKAGLRLTHSADEESEAQGSEGTFPGPGRRCGDVRT